MNTLVEYVKV